jgi:tRNA dimethylallyltransferase
MLIAIVGPTAAGKSALALALAEKLGAEIISADSRAVYRDLDIGTAKPSMEARGQVTHHMIDVVAPDQHFSMADYLELAQQLLDTHAPRIIVGGTGFYLRGLLEGIVLEGGSRDQQFRESLAPVPTPDLYLRLMSMNPSWGMSPNDRGRIIRALEIERSRPRHGGIQHASRQALWLGLYWPKREDMRRRIHDRTVQMLARGLREETFSLVARYGDLELLHKTIGYRECLELPAAELQEEISSETYKFAKRQLTWFRARPQIHWLDCETSDLLPQAWEKVASFGELLD